MADETARPVAEIAHAFTIARAVLGLPDIWQQIDALDGKIGGQIQLELYSRTQDALAHTTRWFMRDGQAVGAAGGLDAAIATHAKGAADLAALLDGKIAGGTKGKLDAARQQLVDEGGPMPVSRPIWPASRSLSTRQRSPRPRRVRAHHRRPSLASCSASMSGSTCAS